MPDLLDVIPAKQLLNMSKSKCEDFAAILSNAMLEHNSINKQYRREIAQVWAFNMDTTDHAEWRTDETSRLTDLQIAGAAKDIIVSCDIDRAIGAVLCEFGTRRVEKMEFVELPNPDDEVVTRFKTLFQLLATDCSFDKFGDRYLWNLLRFEVAAPLEASLSLETPYAAINVTHGERVNDLVQGWIRTLPQDLPGRIDWSSQCPQGLVCIAGVFQEHLDDTALPVYVNGEVARKFDNVVLGGTQGMCDIPDTCGCIHNKIYYVASKSNGYISVFLKAASLMETKDLYWALVDPMRLPPSCPLKQYT